MTLDELFPKEIYPFRAKTNIEIPEIKISLVATVYYSGPPGFSDRVGVLSSIIYKEEEKEEEIVASFIFGFDKMNFCYYVDGELLLPLNEDELSALVEPKLAQYNIPDDDNIFDIIDERLLEAVWQPV